MARRTLTEAEKKSREAERVKKFKEVGTRRLNNALKAINALVPVANKNQYTYTDEQTAKIKKALDEACERVNNAFKGQTVSSGGIEL